MSSDNWKRELSVVSLRLKMKALLACCFIIFMAILWKVSILGSNNPLFCLWRSLQRSNLSISTVQTWSPPLLDDGIDVLGSLSGWSKSTSCSHSSLKLLWWISHTLCSTQQAAMMCGTISMCISNFLANLHQCVLSLPKAISTTTQVLEMTYKIFLLLGVQRCWEREMLY